MKITTQNYGQFLINGVNNYTATYFSQIVEGLEHDSVWRYLNGPKLGSKVIWERVSKDIIYSKRGYQDFRTLAKNSMWITPNCHLKNFQWFFFQLIYIHIFSKSLCVQYNPG